MLKEEGATGGGGGGWARMCDSCRAAACTVYCQADSAYLCAGCDSRIHAANQVASRHERVWVCESCERAPAAFTCKADAAVLCTNCDADIHSANPLARRHHRVPVLPISGCLYGPPSATNPVRPMEQESNLEDGFMISATAAQEDDDEDLDEDDDETASWLLLNPPVKNSNNNNNNNNNNSNQGNNGFLFGGEVDEYLDLVGYNSSTENQYNHHHYGVPQQKNNDGSDSVVPVHGIPAKEQQHLQQQQQQQHSLQLEMDYEASKPGFSYATSLSHSVSFSSMDASVVPEATTMSDISNSHPRPPKGTIDLFSSPPLPMPSQFTPMDREARVLRYREKRKTRKFEKTIRYASRKAYAETRPRIKGRFAKRTDVEVEVDQMFSTTIIAESGYGVVPSF